MKLILACVVLAAVAACADTPTPGPTDQMDDTEYVKKQNPYTHDIHPEVWQVQHQAAGETTLPGNNPAATPPVVAMPPFHPGPSPACTSCPQTTRPIPVPE